MQPELLVERADDGVCLLTMNRPEQLNALGGDMLTLLLDALRDAAADGEVGCVVLTGAGRGFCAGGDMKARAAGDHHLQAAAPAVGDRALDHVDLGVRPPSALRRVTARLDSGE